MKLSETRLVNINNEVYTEITVYNYRGRSKTAKFKGNLLTLEGDMKMRHKISKLKEELDNE